jgi:hypothetical protein
MSKTAPEATLTGVALERAPINRRVPPLIVVGPAKVLRPPRLSVPEPTLFNPPLPLMTPINVVDALLVPTLSAPVPSSTFPAPAMELIVCVVPFEIERRPHSLHSWPSRPKGSRSHRIAASPRRR